MWLLCHHDSALTLLKYQWCVCTDFFSYFLFRIFFRNSIIVLNHHYFVASYSSDQQHTLKRRLKPNNIHSVAFYSSDRQHTLKRRLKPNNCIMYYFIVFWLGYDRILSLCRVKFLIQMLATKRLVYFISLLLLIITPQGRYVSLACCSNPPCTAPREQ